MLLLLLLLLLYIARFQERTQQLHPQVYFL